MLSPEQTGIDFQNDISNTPDLNIQNYGYFYDGAGVASGDINNDGLPDLYFVGNDQENRLYLNRGNFEFEDITDAAGVGGGTEGWSTGVTIADVNGDRYLDIYVSRVNYANKKGPNQLFINNADGSFTEKAREYGLDFKGYSTQAAFFDYDKDGDLDLYLLNHSFHSENTKGKAQMLRERRDYLAGDRLYQNNGNSFEDVTADAGIYSSSLGYGLGLAISDINRDGWPDIYVGNDYHEDDYLYINNGDGTFREALEHSISHTSKSSMGNDIGDLNNDGRVEILSLDMLPEDRTVLRYSGILNSYGRMRTDLRFGYKPQFSHNTLQYNWGSINNEEPHFSDIGFAAGVATTDWSWAALMMDMDNNGFKDIYITNGLIGRPTDMDYNFLLHEQSQRISFGDDQVEENLKLIEEMPEVKIPNYTYSNQGGLKFDDTSEDWGLSQPGFSSGATYADLDNDGSLDLVVNNVNMTAFVYQNKSMSLEESSYLKVKLQGKGKNSSGIGAKVTLHRGEDKFYQEQIPTRGFQSSVDHTLHFGLGSTELIDSLTVVWPDDSFQTIYQVQANQLLEIAQDSASGKYDYARLNERQMNGVLQDITDQFTIDYQHSENRYTDFSRDPGLPYMISREGPAFAHGDINGDGLEDLFLGGARGQPGSIYLQQTNESFSRLSADNSLFEQDREMEDVAAVFFEANGDGRPDLYVVSGGNEFQNGGELMRDRLYLNTGDGTFLRAPKNIPPIRTNGSVVVASDFNSDGAVDLFVGGQTSQNYGLSPASYLLKNDGNGNFTDVTVTVAPELRNIGMVTDAEWSDMDGSGHLDLVVVGEWMPVRIFNNDGERLTMVDGDEGLNQTSGLWSELLVDDFNDNGRPDIIAGNFGINSRLQASTEYPLRLYVQDFEQNGQITSILAYPKEGDYYPLVPVNELLNQYTSISLGESDYSEFAEKSMTEIFGEEIISTAEIKEITTLSSQYIENGGNTGYEVHELPFKAQLSPVKGLHSGDFDRDGSTDLLLGGNLFAVKPSIGGRQDASYCLMLKGDGNGQFTVSDIADSGFYTRGEVRGIFPVSTSESDPVIMVIKNDKPVQVFEITNDE
ncbi:VCBS repeat-containing protein [Aliifodinibius sp. S!AR15-10]|uniref:VCBS repeat-containing protein n=1 Tax=Aliifodinibius sp. S!AR15-10 TaxID=2950437 RepID=UPI002870895B|nr:VCBS repeat-containing protein [Aliifodinibius sp. S!AR15-10]